MSSPSRPEPGEGDDQRHDTLFLTRKPRVWVAVTVAGLVLLIPLYLAGYDFAHRLLFSGAGVVAGIGAAESAVRFTGRSRKAGILLFLASAVWFVVMVLLV